MLPCCLEHAIDVVESDPRVRSLTLQGRTRVSAR